MTTPPPVSPSPLRSLHTTSLPRLLEQLDLSLLVSTYQAGKLVLVRAEGGVANTHFVAFDTPMGVAFREGRLAVGTKLHVWEFRNQPEVAPKLSPPGRHDACFLPRCAHVTGNISIHEIAWSGSELWLVNTRFSCLCTLERDYSFVPRWRPMFISGYAPEDRCHLNGLGLMDGRPRFVTALGETDTAGGWRANKVDGGCLIDVTTNEVLLRGLSMPHSPRWYADRLWLLESGKGSLAFLENGRLETLVELPGFTRGLAFGGPFAFVGLSQVRETAVFGGLQITRPGLERTCGVWVVNIHTREVVAFLRFEEAVQEVFAVEVLPGIRYPELLTEDENVIGNSWVLPDEALRDVPPSHTT